MATAVTDGMVVGSQWLAWGLWGGLGIALVVSVGAVVFHRR